MSIPARPTVPTTIVTSRTPRTKKVYLGEKRAMEFRVVEQFGAEQEWVCSRVEVFSPDGEVTTLTEEIAEPSDGLFVVSVEFTLLGIYELRWFFGPEDHSEAYQARQRMRVVA